MNDFIELRRVLGIISHRWWLLVILPIIYGGLGYAASKTQTPVYTASTTMLAGEIINAVDLNRQDIMASDLMAVTYKELIHRQPVMQAVVDSLGLSINWQSLKKQVSVVLVEGTQLLQITVEASSPEAAQRIADEVAYQLMLYAPEVFRNVENEDILLFVQQQLTNLQERIEAGHSRMTALESAMVTTTSAEKLTELQAEAKTLETLIADWENNYTQLLLILQSKKNLNKLTIIESAQSNPNPIRPKPAIYILAGMGIAFFLGLALIFLIEHIENTIKFPDEITQDFRLPILGYIARINEARTGNTGVFVSENPRSAIAEAYRELRAHLELIEIEEPLKKILVTSCDIGVGTTSVAANLATTIGQGEKGVVLVDADLRRSGVHELMGLKNEVGLSDVIQKGKEISEAIQESPECNVKVLTAGIVPPSGKPGPFEALGSKRMDKILANLGKNNDIVILDGPPLFVSDALLLSTKVDGVLLVIQLGRTRRKHVRAMLEQLSRVNARVIGVVLSQLSPKEAQRYGDVSAYFSEKIPASRDADGKIVAEGNTLFGKIQALGRRFIPSPAADANAIPAVEVLETDEVIAPQTQMETIPEGNHKSGRQAEQPEKASVRATKIKKKKGTKSSRSSQPALTQEEPAEEQEDESAPASQPAQAITAEVDSADQQPTDGEITEDDATIDDSEPKRDEQPEPVLKVSKGISAKAKKTKQKILEGAEEFVIQIKTDHKNGDDEQDETQELAPVEAEQLSDEAIDAGDTVFDSAENFIEAASKKVSDQLKQ